jgi:peptidoglycan/xylan/chitin deacetylase (PgdA/CDA1 family)
LTSPIPEQALLLDWDGQSFEWRFGSELNTPRQSLDSLYERLRGMMPEARARALQQIRTWRGADPPIEARALTETELISLAESALFDIGSHTVTHPVLIQCSSSEQHYEIQQSKRDLENLLNYPVNGFSFPHGAFSADTQRLVQDAQYTFACTSENEVVSKHSDLFALPRFWPGDWDGDQFERWLRRWLL